MAERSNKWSLLGIPDHQGVVHVRGRLGAAEGPAAFRRVFDRFSGALVKDGLTKCSDFGDLTDLGPDIELNHRRAAEAVKRAHSETGFSVVVGGGHDHGYSHLLGLGEALGKNGRLGCINLDAHLDVRKPDPLPSSGSPFYLAIESGTLKPSRLIEFGIQTHCNSPALWSYVKEKKVRVVGLSDIRGKVISAFKAALKKLAATSDCVAISLDLDAIDEAAAPGVSAPQAEGFTTAEVIEMMEIAGAHRKVASLGIFELSPPHDIGDRTARIAATAAYHFIESRFRS